MTVYLDNQDNKRNNFIEHLAEKNSRTTKGKLFVYRLLNFLDYHSYRLHIACAKGIVILALFMMLISVFITNRILLFALGNCVIGLLAFYMFMSYGIFVKARQMKNDSKELMKRIAFSGIISQAWNLYNGIYEEDGAKSLEIVFGTERAWISNFYSLLLHHHKTLPLSDSDIQNLKGYLEILHAERENGNNYVVYGTMSWKLANQIMDSGIKLVRIPRHYRTKPQRWDYAVATGKWSNALLNYPSDFDVYLLDAEAQEQMNQVEMNRVDVLNQRIPADSDNVAIPDDELANNEKKHKHPYKKSKIRYVKIDE